MRFDGENLDAVLKAHKKWILSGGENDDDRADFSETDVSYMDLNRKMLYGANFRNAMCIATDFYRSDLERCDFTGANVHEACFTFASTRGAIGLPHIPMVCPDTGSFVGWKRIKANPDGHHYENSLIAKLLIPEDAQRVSMSNGECRASKAIVLEIQTLDGQVIEHGVGVSIYDRKTLYVPGATVEANGFSKERDVHHTQGIFFYVDRRSAVEYLTMGNVPGDPEDMLFIDGAETLKALEESNHW